MKMRQSDFVKNSHIPAKLIRATVRQLGGWEYFQETANDITNHGANSGFSGFTYYRDTLAFFRRNRASIMEMTEQMADALGEGMLKMIAGFNCHRGYDFTEDGIARALYTGKGDDATNIQNAMAWFALEEVARSYVDCLESVQTS
jgi:hypothetical protein